MARCRCAQRTAYVQVIVSACCCQSAAEPRYRALAGKKGMVECQRRGDIVAVLPRLELATVHVVVAHMHASAESYAAQAAKETGWTAARAEQTKRTRFVEGCARSWGFPVCAVCG